MGATVWTWFLWGFVAVLVFRAAALLSRVPGVFRRRRLVSPREAHEDLRRRLGYSIQPIDWQTERVDWRAFPFPEDATWVTPYRPEHVASSFRELEAALSQEAAQGAIARLEHALGDPSLFVVFPAAVPASQRLLDIVADPAALPWARWGAASVLTTLLEEPDPGIHLGGPSDDSIPRTHQGIARAVKERAEVLRKLASNEDRPGSVDRPTRFIIQHVLRLAGES